MAERREGSAQGKEDEGRNRKGKEGGMWPPHWEGPTYPSLRIL